MGALARKQGVAQLGQALELGAGDHYVYLV